MASTKFATTAGRAFGVFLGCILGMFPLLFMDAKKSQDEENPKDNHGSSITKKKD
jgi:hypothetical protein